MSVPGKIVDANPPASVDAEKAVIGSMILDPAAIEIVCQVIDGQAFYQLRHQHLFKVICDLHDQGVSVDFTTLIDEMRRRKLLEEVGGPGYIASLEQHVFSTLNVADHAVIVRRKHQLRELIRVCQVIQEEAYTERDTVDEILDHAEKLVFDLSEKRTTREFQSLGDLTFKTMDEIEHRCSKEHEVPGVATGYVKLDEKTGGFQKSDLLILAARPSMGKTAFALNLALNIGAGLRGRHLDPKLQRPVGVFSLEMSASQINQRLLSSLSEVPMHEMRTGFISMQDRHKLHQYARQLHSVPIFIDDTPGISIFELRAKARRLHTMHPDLAMIVIDYLQLMRGGNKVENRQQEIAEITRSLKALARELNIPILALSQLSRLIEQRKGKNQRPLLSDLRESGAIEQDADVVMFIHRERTADKRDESYAEKSKARINAGKAELIIGKQRNGPIGTVELVFFEETATFQTLARQTDSDEEEDDGGTF